MEQCWANRCAGLKGTGQGPCLPVLGETVALSLGGTHANTQHVGSGARLPLQPSSLPSLPAATSDAQR